ncbi:ZNF407 [Cordylochernes scorpioides]|uniref:ZNF407 n=1 Tax=Cordylochernes scorpioides TaxID=51811 RepID=A0ABY6KL84_9ARAC|nr:ZNF407 [Cordylochernes scorpioides]
MDTLDSNNQSFQEAYWELMKETIPQEDFSIQLQEGGDWEYVDNGNNGISFLPQYDQNNIVNPMQIIPQNVNPSTLKKRKFNFPNVERPFICNHCQYRAVSRSILKGHMRIHTGEKPFHCDKCSYRACLKPDLEKHKRIHTKEKPYQCQFCEHRTAHKSNLDIHMRKHTENKPFRCQICGYNCPTRSMLKKHLKSHETLQNASLKFQCENCNFHTSTKAALSSHIRSHPIGPRRECEICGDFISETAYVPHMEHHKQQQLQLTCHICGHTTKNMNRHQNHMFEHEKEAGLWLHSFSCNECNFQTQYNTLMEKHLQEHKGQINHICECGYQTTKKSNFNRHKLTHLGIKNHHCPYCEHSSLELNSLKRHIEVRHSNIPQYICTFNGCSFKTPIERYLKNHVKEHTSKSVKCEHCDYSSNNKSDVKKHEKIHFRNESFICELCNYSSASRTALTKHMKCHDILKCKECLFQTDEQIKFQLHKKIHENDNEGTEQIFLDDFQIKNFQSDI